MGKSQRIREEEYRAVYRLLSDLREMRHDRPALHQHLIESLTAMLGATGGFAMDVNGLCAGGTPSLSSFTATQAGIDIVTQTMRSLAANNNFWDDPTCQIGMKFPGRSVGAVPFHRLMSAKELAEGYPLFSQVKSDTSHMDHLVAWYTQGATLGNLMGISLHRYGKNEKLFNGRETEIARLLFEELHWLQSTGRLDPVVPGITELPPRLKQVLDALLKGRPPKRIARELGLTTLTVRDHIRRLYRQLDVNGRDELMAKFIR